MISTTTTTTKTTTKTLLTSTTTLKKTKFQTTQNFCNEMEDNVMILEEEEGAKSPQCNISMQAQDLDFNSLLASSDQSSKTGLFA